MKGRTSFANPVILSENFRGEISRSNSKRTKSNTRSIVGYPFVFMCSSVRARADNTPHMATLATIARGTLNERSIISFEINVRVEIPESSRFTSALIIRSSRLHFHPAQQFRGRGTKATRHTAEDRRLGDGHQYARWEVYYYYHRLREKRIWLVADRTEYVYAN